MSMGHLLIHLEEMAETAGLHQGMSAQYEVVAKKEAQKGRHVAADHFRAEAEWHDAKHRELKARCAEIREEGLQRYFAQQAVRVTDLRSGNHDRHEIEEAAE